VASYVADVSDEMRGWLVWYAIPERSVPHSQLVAAARAAGFPTDFLPNPLDRRAAWEQAFTLPEAGASVTPSEGLRQRCPDPGLVCRLHVRVVRRRLPYVRHLELEVICPGATSPEEQRRTALVALLRLDDRGHSTATVMGPWTGMVQGAEVERVISDMEKEFRCLLEAAPPGASREAVRRYLHSLSAVLLRATGALYYVPHSACPDGTELLACREFVRRASGGQLTCVRLLAGDAQAVADVRAAVVESLRRQLAGIHDLAVRAREQDRDRRAQVAEKLFHSFQQAAETATRVRTSLHDTLQELDDLLALAKKAVASL